MHLFGVFLVTQLRSQRLYLWIMRLQKHLAPIWDLDPYEDDVKVLPFAPEADLLDAAGKPFEVRSVADALINAEVMLPNGVSMAIAKVVRRGIDENGRMIGTFDTNPLLNTLMYECKFDDGTT